jgi:hypothetical protein
VGGEEIDEWQAVEAFLTRCHTAPEAISRTSEVVADELRIVAAWLQRTRTTAHWVPLGTPSDVPAALEAVRRVLSSRRLPS